MTDVDFLRRTRSSYDSVAVDYAEWIRDELAVKPMDRALLATFAELTQDGGSQPVADIGCGPGRLTTYLHQLGVPAFGIDLSPEMVAVARRAYPDVRFDVGSMTELELDDASVGGILAWYSIIHVPGDRLGEVFAEFQRVLAPGGYLQLAFQVGDELTHYTEAAGHAVSLDFHRRRPEAIIELLSEAGLSLCAQTVREPDAHGPFAERTPQGYLLARKPAAPGTANVG